MPADTFIERDILQYVDSRRDDLIDIIQTLVRTPSENTPPTGAEAACQRFCEAFLKSCGFTTDLYALGDVPVSSTTRYSTPAITRTPQPCRPPLQVGRRPVPHPLRHMDTVPRGTLAWTRDPHAHIETAAFWRGSNDMKAASPQIC